METNVLEPNLNLNVLFSKSIASIEQVYGKKLHKSRTDFMKLVVLGLVSSRNVQFGEIADKMSGDADTESKQRRIQRFISEYDLDYEWVSHFLIFLLPKQGKLKICMDRTEWEFGDQNHNVLVVTVYSHGIGIPIWFEVLDNNGGNSCSDDRIYVMLTLLKVLGANRISSVIADCEFIGEEWIKWLYEHKITFYIDVRTNQNLIHKNKIKKINSLLEHRKTRVLDKVQIFGLELGIAVMASAKAGKKSLAIITNKKASEALCNYKARWSIEVLFACLKTKGFNLENTHLKCPVRLRKLFALVTMAFTICFLVGLVAHKDNPINIKKHGYKTNSFFRSGLDILRKVIKNSAKIDFKPIMERIIDIISRNVYVTQKIVM